VGFRWRIVALVVRKDLNNPPTTVGGFLTFCANLLGGANNSLFFATGIKFFPGQDGYIIPAHKEQ
jgi:hypothetical protein